MTLIISGNSTISGNSQITHKLLLDAIPNMQYVYCDDLVRTAHTGSSIHVYRASDAKIEEFGFVNGTTDWEAANRFVAGATIYLTRRANQGLEGGYAEQTNPALMPQLVIDSDTGLPCAMFDSTYLRQQTPDIGNNFVNDLCFYTAFRTKAFRSPNDFYSGVGREDSPHDRGIGHWITSTGAGDNFRLVADAAWPVDTIVVPAQHSVGPLKVITHCRSGTRMSTKVNGIELGVKNDVIGDLKFYTGESFLDYGGNAYQHCYMQAWCSDFNRAAEQDKIVLFAMNRYT